MSQTLYVHVKCKKQVVYVRITKCKRILFCKRLDFLSFPELPYQADGLIQFSIAANRAEISKFFHVNPTEVDFKFAK